MLFALWVCDRDGWRIVLTGHSMQMLQDYFIPAHRKCIYEITPYGGNKQ